MEIDLTPYRPSEPLVYGQAEWRVWLYRTRLLDARVRLRKAQREVAEAERLEKIVVEQLESINKAVR